MRFNCWAPRPVQPTSSAQDARKRAMHPVNAVFGRFPFDHEKSRFARTARDSWRRSVFADASLHFATTAQSSSLY